MRSSPLKTGSVVIDGRKAGLDLEAAQTGLRDALAAPVTFPGRKGLAGVQEVVIMLGDGRWVTWRAPSVSAGALPVFS